MAIFTNTRKSIDYKDFITQNVYTARDWNISYENTLISGQAQKYVSNYPKYSIFVMP